MLERLAHQMHATRWLAQYPYIAVIVFSPMLLDAIVTLPMFFKVCDFNSFFKKTNQLFAPSFDQPTSCFVSVSF